MRTTALRIAGSSFLMFLLAFPALAATKAAARLKTCPVDECAFGPWRARADVSVYKEQDTSSEVVFKAVKGDTVTGMAAELVVYKLGTCVTTKPVQAYESSTKAPVRLKARERISALYYSNDNYVVGNYMRKRVEACCTGDDLDCRTPPQNELWLKVKSATGIVGWTNQRDSFSGTKE